MNLPSRRSIVYHQLGEKKKKKDKEKKRKMCLLPALPFASWEHLQTTPTHPPPSPGFSGAIMILSLFRANTLQSSRRSFLKCPHQLQTHLPKAFLSSFCPFTRFSPIQRVVISASADLNLPHWHPFYGSYLPVVFFTDWGLVDQSRQKESKRERLIFPGLHGKPIKP